MKILSIACLIFLLISCNSRKSNKKLFSEDTKLSLADSLEVQRRVDDMLQKTYKDALFDTTGLSIAPVKVTKARLVKRDYSSYKDIQLTFKNISQKKISAIRFKWYGLNAFNEPAEMGQYGMLKGFGGGFTDDPLNPGKSSSGTWEIMSNNAKTIVLALPYEVAFSDGTKWKIE